MKNLVILTCLLTITFSGWSMKNDGINNNPIQVLSTNYDMFYFKADKSLIGAEINVYDYTTGKIVLTQVVNNKRTIVNLQIQHPGDYIILITKGEFSQKYVQHKTSAARYINFEGTPEDTMDNLVIANTVASNR